MDNSIKKIVDKYKGKYQEFEIKKIHTPFGKYEIQPLKGTINIDNTIITINKNENIGIQLLNQDTVEKEPFRIILHLQNNKSTLNIYPKSKIKKILSKLINKTNKQFEFKGDKELVRRLSTDRTLQTLLFDKNYFVSVNQNYPNKLMLIPEQKNVSIADYELIFKVLKKIEEILLNIY